MDSLPKKLIDDNKTHLCKYLKKKKKILTSYGILASNLKPKIAADKSQLESDPCPIEREASTICNINKNGKSFCPFFVLLRHDQ